LPDTVGKYVTPEADHSLRLPIGSAGLTLFSDVVEPRYLGSADKPKAKPVGKGSFPMPVRGSGRISRHRTRARKRIFGAAFILFGILLWGVAATAHLKPDALSYSGITVGGAVVVVGIILFATTL
jgi:hypothetical protein